MNKIKDISINKNRILITGSVLNSDKESKSIYINLIDICKRSGSIISSPIDTMKFNGNDYERYDRAMKLLQDTKIVIAEMSNVSTGQGMELQEAVRLNIPIIVIAKQGSKISGLIKGCRMLKEVLFYNNIEDIEERIIQLIN